MSIVYPSTFDHTRIDFKRAYYNTVERYYNLDDQFQNSSNFQSSNYHNSWILDNNVSSFPVILSLVLLSSKNINDPDSAVIITNIAPSIISGLTVWKDHFWLSQTANHEAYQRTKALFWPRSMFVDYDKRLCELIRDTDNLGIPWLMLIRKA